MAATVGRGLIYGLRGFEYEVSGGFAEAFNGNHTERGTVFSPAGNDADLGYPLIEVPDEVYPFQEAESGALFHISTALNVLYPSVEDAALRVLDPLDTFARKFIRQALRRRSWLGAYPHLEDYID